MGTAVKSMQRDASVAAGFRRGLVALSHRGPDARGEYEDANLLLGHARLSILDLSPAGRQPMQTPDGRFVIAYNGEVYNFKELAKEHVISDLRSGSDTEVVLRLFAKLGIGALAMLNGMFAFAVYDRTARKLWLVRDRLGIKPFYYRLTPDQLIFASEIKAIQAFGVGERTCDLAALHEWLYFGNPLAGKTLYSDTSQLPPGHYLEIDLNSFEHTVGAYWSLKEAVEGAAPGVGDTRSVIGETRRLLEQAVQRQLVSDVPVGLFLSGGVDSSAIAAFASRHYGRRLATYSAGFDFAPDGGELPKAKRVAARYGTEHHEIHISGGGIGDLVERMVSHHDMPFSDAANIPLYLMASQISGHVKVVLQGDGGDELFGGYGRNFTMSHYRLFHPLARALQHLLRLTPRSPFHYRVRRFLRAFAAGDIGTTAALLLTPEDRSLVPAAVFTDRLRRHLERSDPFARHRDCQHMFADQDMSNQMSFLDLMITLPDTFLEKVDRATMAASLEVRVPFLDNDLVDFVAPLPGCMKMPRGRQKWLLKAALEGIVPDEVLHGAKRGLSVPYGHWLKGALKPLFFDHLSKFVRRNHDVLDIEYVTRLFARTASGGRDDSYMLWKVLNFMIWANSSKTPLCIGAAAK